VGKTTVTLLILLSISPAFLHADVLLLEGISKEPANSKNGVPRPTQGMTANTVKEKWGIPKGVTEPVGNPPIHRWEYEKFYVFFENEHVIHSVFKKPKELKQDSKNAKK